MSGKDVPALSEAFMAIVELCDALGVSKINRLPGCWTHQIDARWWVAVNGHGEIKTALAPTGTSSAVPAEVPPYGAYAEFCGWPFAYFGPTGGVMGAGDAAKEDTFIEAIRAATRRARAERPCQVRGCTTCVDRHAPAAPSPAAGGAAEGGAK